MADLESHRYRVSIRVGRPTPRQRLSLPVWIPGSYLVREFSRNLQGLAARQGGKPLEATQVDKNTWELVCTPSIALLVEYDVVAYDNSVRSAWLDEERGFFNGTSLFLRVHGQEQLPHGLEIEGRGAPVRWIVATGLTPVTVSARGFGRYQAANYDELVDCPVEMGQFWSGTFVAAGVPHRMVVAGAAASFDGERLLADTQRICEAAITFWHGAHDKPRTARRPPHASYLFLVNAVDDGYGGLEHCNSTALVCCRKDLPRLPLEPSGKKPTPQAEGYTTLLGLISHEYFHTWNVKRLRPVEFSQYEYDRENYTQLLWFFEGFTSYYDDLLLRRCGLTDDAQYLKQLTKTLNQVQQTPGRLVQTVAQASFDAWVKYYRQDENTPNATVSYYSKGAAVALCLDLGLRAQGQTTLDAVMRALWRRCAGGPMVQDDLLQVLKELSGRDWSAQINLWVHSTQELPLKESLEQHGVAVLEEPSQIAQALGLRVTETNGIQIKVVLRGSAAERSGMASGDEWMGVEELGTASRRNAWRLTRLDDLALYARPGQKLIALVARDKRILRLPLQLPVAVTTWRLAARDSAALARWLAG
ncbi:MAG: peptidase M61 [Rhodoferax sp.]|nr:peptidase M61 [Rhodoferax sp.]